MNIGILLAPALAAAVVSYALTPIAGIIAVRLGAVDQPGPRKIHLVPIPRLGGLAVVAAIFVGMVVTRWLLPLGSRTLPTYVSLGIGLGVLPIIAVSIRDDIKAVDARWKFLVHIIGAVIAVSFGVSLNGDLHLFGHTVSIGVLAFPLSVLWIVGASNAFNIVDGLDGLSAGLALISAVSLAGVFMIVSQVGAAAAVLVVAGALCGFLPYNVYPARMFLGDTGAMAVGFCLAAFALRGGATLSAGFATLLPVFILGLPIAETLISMARRLLRRLDHKDTGGLFTPDKNHMHHRLLALGIGHPAAVFILYGVGLLLTCGALLSMLMTARDAALLVIALLLAGFFGIRSLAYDEFAVIRNGVALRVYDAPVINSAMFVVFVDLAFVAMAAYAAVGLKTDDWHLTTYRASAFGMIAVLAPITVAVFSRMGLYRENWRLAGVENFGRAWGAVLIATALGLTVRMILFSEAAPVSLYSIYAMLSLLLVIGSRASHQFLVASQQRPGQPGTAALIYGAGRQGVGAFRELLRNVSANLRPVAFIDDDPSNAGKIVNGVPVAGSVHNLEAVIRRFDVGAVIVTSDNIPEAHLAKAGEVCQRAGVTLLRMQVTFDQCYAASGLRDAPSSGRPPNLPVKTSSRTEVRVSAIIWHPCPACRSLAAHRSHARNVIERARKKLTSRRPYRCEQCGWRGWSSILDVAVHQPLAFPVDLPVLESIDTALGARPSHAPRAPGSARRAS